MIPLAFALTLAAVVTAPAFGQQSAPSDADSRTRPLWEVGAVGLGVSQQAYPGSDRQVNRALALPWFVYRGRYLRADNEGVGLRAVRTPRYEFDVSAAGAFGSRAGDDPKRQGMPVLGTLVEIGPRLRVHLGGTPEGGALAVGSSLARRVRPERFARLPRCGVPTRDFLGAALAERVEHWRRCEPAHCRRAAGVHLSTRLIRPTPQRPAPRTRRNRACWPRASRQRFRKASRRTGHCSASRALTAWRVRPTGTVHS